MMCKDTKVGSYTPKVGEVCEAIYVRGAGKWFPTTIKFIDSCCVVYSVGTVNSTFHHDVRDFQFRKLQSEEEKFVESYITHINCKEGFHTSAARPWAEGLYRAGFRYMG